MFGACAGDDQLFAGSGVLDPAVCQLEGRVCRRDGYILDVVVDVLDVRSQTRDSESKDIVEDEVSRRRIVSSAQDGLDLGAEEQVDGGVWDVELHGGCADRRGEGDVLFDGDDGRCVCGGCGRDSDWKTGGVGVYGGGTESESHVG